MKIEKKILLLIGIIILLVTNHLKYDYIRLNLLYTINKSKYEEVFDVQGNTGKYVPQGMAYSEKYNVVLQTSYSSKKDVSMLYVTDFSSGNLIKSLQLQTPSGKENTTHVGGIATDNNYVWITSDNEIHEYLLEDIISTDEDYIKSTVKSKLPIRGDFCYYGNDTLYIGDFFLNPFYKVPDNNPLLLAYNTKEDYSYSEPEYIISLPKMVQGMTILPGNRFAFTTSFTFLIQSELLIYNNVLDGNASTYNFNGVDVPYYKFEKSNRTQCIKLPPMAEGVFSIDNDVYMLFESSSDKYRLAYPRLKKVVKYKL